MVCQDKSSENFGIKVNSVSIFILCNSVLYSSYVCAKCEVKLLENEVRYRFRLTLVICDSTTHSVVTVFGTCLEQFFGCTASYFNK